MIQESKTHSRWFYIGFSYSKNSNLKLKPAKAVSVPKL